MPLYTVYHPHTLSHTQRKHIALSITKAHVTITLAPSFVVKVIFLPLDASSFYTGGLAELSLLRIVGVIRAGRSTEDRQKLLMMIHDMIKIHGYEIEIHLEEMKSEVNSTLNKLIQNILVNGKFVPEPGSEDEKRWREADKAV
jgi:phenylpyruvate tautomerase PptA (4-oxalocrotonate tautomerase family)